MACTPPSASTCGDWFDPGSYVDCGAKAFDESAHLAIDAQTDANYLMYWGSYALAREINQVGCSFGPVGSTISHVISAPLVVPQAAGLGVDAGLDAVKAQLVPGYPGPRDEGLPNQYLFGNQAGPVLNRLLGLDWRVNEFPGIHPNGQVDFEW
jgi:hypothetical protein